MFIELTERNGQSVFVNVSRIQSSPRHPGSSSFLVMMFDRTCEIETVYRNSDRKMPQPPNNPGYKDIQSPFTKSAEDPEGPVFVMCGEVVSPPPCRADMAWWAHRFLGLRKRARAVARITPLSIAF